MIIRWHCYGNGACANRWHHSFITTAMSWFQSVRYKHRRAMHEPFTQTRHLANQFLRYINSLPNICIKAETFIMMNKLARNGSSFWWNDLQPDTFMKCSSKPCVHFLVTVCQELRHFLTKKLYVTYNEVFANHKPVNRWKAIALFWVKKRKERREFQSVSKFHWHLHCTWCIVLISGRWAKLHTNHAYIV